MKIETYVRTQKINIGQFAEAIGVSRSNFYRLCDGQIPRIGIMRRIYVETGGAVAPNDFYDLPEIGGEE